MIPPTLPAHIYKLMGIMAAQNIVILMIIMQSQSWYFWFLVWLLLAFIFWQEYFKVGDK